MKYLSTIPGIIGTAVLYWLLILFLPSYAPSYIATLAIAFITAVGCNTYLDDAAKVVRYSAISFTCAILTIYLAGTAMIAGKFVLWPILAMMASVVIMLASWLSYKDNFDKLNIKGWSLKPILYYIIILALMIYLAPKIFPIPPRLAGKF